MCVFFCSFDPILRCQDSNYHIESPRRDSSLTNDLLGGGSTTGTKEEVSKVMGDLIQDTDMSKFFDEEFEVSGSLATRVFGQQQVNTRTTYRSHFGTEGSFAIWSFLNRAPQRGDFGFCWFLIVSDSYKKYRKKHRHFGLFLESRPPPVSRHTQIRVFRCTTRITKKFPALLWRPRCHIVMEFCVAFLMPVLFFPERNVRLESPGG